MMAAAFGVWLAAGVSQEAMFGLGIVLAVASLLAIGLYTRRAQANQPAK
jgi:DHA1 family bicyclomycin/chloramphenicol resistance-like MFS transporter